jgi:hypothetical protein
MNQALFDKTPAKENTEVSKTFRLIRKGLPLLEQRIKTLQSNFNKDFLYKFDVKS